MLDDLADLKGSSGCAWWVSATEYERRVGDIQLAALDRRKQMLDQEIVDLTSHLAEVKHFL